jgi:hypothetical protein
MVNVSFAIIEAARSRPQSADASVVGTTPGLATTRQQRFSVAEDAFDGWQSEWLIGSGK